MAIRSIERLDNEPIILVVMEGEHTAEDAMEFYAQLPVLLSAGLNFFIVDVRGIRTDLAELMRILKTEQEQIAQLIAMAEEAMPGISSAIQSYTYLVGSGGLARIYADNSHLERFSGNRMAVFPTVEDALAAARAQLQTLSTGEYRRVMGITPENGVMPVSADPASGRDVPLSEAD
jgi:uncharacterized protein YqiB (DUF1249 family)